MGDPVYLDHYATTRPDPRVVEATAPYVSERFGHPASRQHAWGWDAERAVETAREEVASLLGAHPREIVFTSGAAEADNLAVKGAAAALESRGRHVVTTAVEGRPVLDACAWLESRGWEVARVGVDGRGRVAPEAVAEALRPETALVSVQLANHEVGTIQDLAAIGRLCAPRGVWLHTDASAAALWEPLDVQALGVHLLSLTGHRMHGPKGIGVLYVRRRRPRVRLVPLIHGGGHEQGLRSGTVNVPGAVGMGRAAALCRDEREADARRVGALRDRLEAGILEGLEGVGRLGDLERRLPNASALTVEGAEGESLLLSMPEVGLATGSACASATVEPSHVLLAMGLSKAKADTSVRFSLGRFTTAEEVERTVAAAVEAARRVRRLGAPPASARGGPPTP